MPLPQALIGVPVGLTLCRECFALPGAESIFIQR
jgi:hypothetical protein